jgi:glucosamine--fructose-6-phosphate aminotransferase (isomerizing)
MCGIIAYIGSKSCRKNVLDGLTQLEYRGYDSAGFVCINSKHNHFSYHKEAGGVAPVTRLAAAINFDGYVGMGHTRWATHGIVDQRNAHPHFNCKKSIAIVHNGVLEGYEELRQQLLDKGHDFSSSTDTEVAAHLFNDLFEQHKNLKKTVLEFVKQIKGAYAFAILVEQHPDKLIVIKHRSPLIIGLGDDETFVASDLVAFSDKTSKVVFMPDDTFAFVSSNGIELFGFDGKSVPYYVQEIDQTYIDIDREGFEHNLIKEIYEQKRAINRTIAFCKVIGNYNDASGDEDLSMHKNQAVAPEYNEAIWRQMGLTLDAISQVRYINLIGAGTSWHAARIAQFFFETICQIPTRVYLASEFRYMHFFAEPHSLHFMISQSGETSDTLEALRLVNSFEQHTIAITNVASSTMVREASGFLPMQAGPEIYASSTKAFSTQVATLYWLANRIALDRNKITPKQMHEAEEDLFVAAEVLESVIDNYKFAITRELAPRYSSYDRFIFLGRHISYPFALESALKLKEISYIFAQCFPAGELKHGHIALIDERTPVILFSVLDDILYRKMILNANEIKARKGRLIVFAFEGQEELISIADDAFILPRVTPLLTPLAMAGLMHFFVYQISRQLGRPTEQQYPPLAHQPTLE